MNKVLCGCGCGTEMDLLDKYGRPRKFIRGHKHNSTGKDKDYSLWKGNCVTNKRYYIILAEKIIGKQLPPKAVIHHFTENQLVICQNQAYHKLLHQREMAYKECGNANWLKCKYCKEYDDPSNLYLYQTHRSGHHVKCNILYCSQRRLKETVKLRFSENNLIGLAELL